MRRPIVGPAIINVSGGRSSGEMLARAIEDAGGVLPPDVVPIFANTGEEAEGTLTFVREMSERWGVHIRWVEFSAEPRASAPYDDIAHWKEVTYCTASRAGEPFDALIDWKKFLPSDGHRICTEWLKVRAAFGFAASLGFPVRRVRDSGGRWTTDADFDQYLGIRADEPRRIAKNRGREHVELPLADDGVTVEDVQAAWAKRPFDLQIRPGEGNCRLCFEKGIVQLRNVLRNSPDGAGIHRFIDRERRIGATMKKRHSYADIDAFVRHQLPIFQESPEEDVDLRPCACGD